MTSEHQYFWSKWYNSTFTWWRLQRIKKVWHPIVYFPSLPDYDRLLNQPPESILLFLTHRFVLVNSHWLRPARKSQFSLVFAKLVALVRLTAIRRTSSEVTLQYTLDVQGMLVCLLSVYVLATSRWVPTCDSAHSWRLYSAASQEHQATSTSTFYPTQSHYPETQSTSPCPIIIIPRTRLGSR